MTLFWGIVLAAMVIIELCSFQLVSIWFAVGALFAMLSDFLGLPFIGQLAVFVVSSVLLLVFSLPLIKKFTSSKTVHTNAELNVGETAIVIEEINNELSTGRVRLKGVNWAAFSNDNEIIPENSVVTVTQVSGARLEVKIKQKETITK